MMSKKINQYSMVVFDGKGYIKDHWDCKKVVEFNFGLYEEEIAQKCAEACLKILNGR